MQDGDERDEIEREDEWELDEKRGDVEMTPGSCMELDHIAPRYAYGSYDGESDHSTSSDSSGGSAGDSA